jgi:hypothetical protein
MHEWDNFNQANDPFPGAPVSTLDNREVIETLFVARNHH